jgi:putative hydrolase of the HAD superfamily
LADEVDDVLISEEIGVGKPDDRAFRIALERLAAQPAHAAMVGDSFATDVEPALRLGMRGGLLGRGAAPDGVERVERIGDIPAALGVG